MNHKISSLLVVLAFCVMTATSLFAAEKLTRVKIINAKGVLSEAVYRWDSTCLTDEFCAARKVGCHIPLNVSARIKLKKVGKTCKMSALFNAPNNWVDPITVTFFDADDFFIGSVQTYHTPGEWYAENWEEPECSSIAKASLSGFARTPSFSDALQCAQWTEFR